jgi:hypothetical protein
LKFNKKGKVKEKEKEKERKKCLKTPMMIPLVLLKKS